MTHYMMDLFLKTPLIKLIIKPENLRKSGRKFISVTEYEILKDSIKEENSFIISAIHNDLYGLSCSSKKYKD